MCFNVFCHILSTSLFLAFIRNSLFSYLTSFYYFNYRALDSYSFSFSLSVCHLFSMLKMHVETWWSIVFAWFKNFFFHECWILHLNVKSELFYHLHFISWHGNFIYLIFFTLFFKIHCHLAFVSIHLYYLIYEGKT